MALLSPDIQAKIMRTEKKVDLPALFVEMAYGILKRQMGKAEIFEEGPFNC